MHHVRPLSALISPAGSNLPIVGLAGVLALALLMSTPTHAQTFSVLHSFNVQTDGAFPYAGLGIDAAGNLYGTTVYGGASNQGVIYELTP